MRILISNDDGWGAKGILTLIRVLQPMGEITVVAPSGPQSGQSNAMTVLQPVSLDLVKAEPGLRVYTCSGTPTDCVKLAFHQLFPDGGPDLVCSGINHGDNGTINVLYSGTMGAVFEGTVHQVPSIGWSICSHDPDVDFSEMEHWMPEIIRRIMEMPYAFGRCWNVNAPVGPIQGYRFTRHCRGYWEKEWNTLSDDPEHMLFSLAGNYVNLEPEAEDTDQYACAHGYISVCPASTDMTDYDTLQLLRQ